MTLQPDPGTSLETESSAKYRALLTDPLPLVEREYERDALRAALDRAIDGDVRVVLISGRSGVGKTALVNSFKADLGGEQVWFVSGKFERLAAPGQALFTAMDRLIERLLALPENELEGFRARFEDELGENVAVLFSNLPALRTVLGGQAAFTEVQSGRLSDRYLYLFSRLVYALCETRPIVMFMDDLQWADKFSLKILETLVDRDAARSLMLIGAYRDAGVDHRLTHMDRLISTRSAMVHLTLKPLSVAGVSTFLRNVLGPTGRDPAELSEIVFNKTLGNPLAVRLLLQRLRAEDLLTDKEDLDWRWDTAGIRALTVDRDVAEELAKRLRSLDPPSARVLGFAALLGFEFTVEQVAIAVGMTQSEVEAALEGANHQQLIVSVPGSLQFHHDRIRAAALTHLKESGIEEPVAALAMGLRLLRASPASGNWTSWLMLANRGLTAAPIEGGDCRLLVDLNVQAAIEVKASGAAEQAWEYAQAALNWIATPTGVGAETLRDLLWREDKNTARAVIREVAECASMAGKSNTAHELVAELLAHADGLLQEIGAHEISINTKVSEGRLVDAIEDAFALLQRLDVYTPDADDAGLQHDVAQIEAELEKAGITGSLAGSLDRLVEGSQMQHEGYLAAMRIVATLIAPLYISSIERMSQLALACLRLMLRHGWCAETSFVLIVYALVLLRLRKMDRAAEVGELAIALLERDQKQTNQAKTRVFYDWSVRCWRDDLRDTVPVMQRDYQHARAEGEPTFAAVAALFEGVHQYLAGVDLQTVSQTMERSAQAMDKLAQQSFAHMLAVWRQTVYDLQNRVSLPVVFRGPYFNELELLEELEETGNRAAIFHLYYNKLLLAYLFDAPKAELEDLLAELESYWVPSGWAIAALMLFLPSLVRLRMAEAEPAGSKQQLRLREQVAADQRQLSAWAISAPANFAHRYHLVQAELDRLQGYVDGAQDNYRLAIDLAHQHGNAADEGLALELAAKFRANQGALYEAVSDVGAALSTYQAWGAQAKAEHTAVRHGAQVELLTTVADRSSVEKSAERALLSHLPEVFTRPSSARGSLVELMKVTLESMSTDQVSVFMQGHVPEVVTCRRNGDALAEYWFESSELAAAAHEIVGGVYRKTRRTGMMTVISSGQEYELLGIKADAEAALPRSVMCAPISYQGETLGYLYLANHTVSRVYDQPRLENIGQLVAFYGVIIGNLANLNAARQEQRLLHNILQAAPDATLLLAADNRVMYANARADELWQGQAGGGLIDRDAIELVPNNDRLPLVRYFREARAAAPQGSLNRDIRRFDGVDVPTEIRASGMARDPGLLIVTVRDISDRLRAQQEIDRQRRELTRLSRIAEIGALSSSLTHEVSQPLAAILSNAQAGELLLNQPKPDPNLLEDIFGDIVGETKRVRQVIANLRRLASNESVEFEQLNLNRLIEATVVLIKGELSAQGVTLELDLADDMPEIAAAEVGLQQVLLNLLNNAIQSCRGLERARRMITVKSTLDQSGVLIAVSDLGTGIADDVAARVFQPYFTSKQRGLGVGLMICQRIVEEHGGQIWFETNPSQGVTFFVRLPLDS